MLYDSQRHRTPEFDGKELLQFLAAQFNTHIQILPLPRRSVHVVDVTDYSNADDQMVKVTFVSTVSILTPIQVRQIIRALFGSGGGA